jgi:hypothetical protein
MFDKPEGVVVLLSILQSWIILPTLADADSERFEVLVKGACLSIIRPVKISL